MTQAQTKLDVASIYAVEDEDLKRKFSTHLSRSSLIDLKDFHREAFAGQEFEQVQAKMLWEAYGIVLLVSADFFASNVFNIARGLYLSDKGKEFVARGTFCVLPLRSVSMADSFFSDLPFLLKKPVTSHSDRDAAFMKAAEELKRIITKSLLPPSK